MCFMNAAPKIPEVVKAAPPPPTPAPPAPPKVLPKPQDTLKVEEETKPNVQYGKKKSTDVRQKKGTDSLKIPLNTPQGGGSTGGLNV